MEKQTSLLEVWGILRKRLLLIICIFLLSIAGAVTVSLFILTPVYEASTQMLINQKKNDKNLLNSQDIETDLQLINTYNIVIKSPLILTKVIEILQLEIPLEKLEKNISINNQQNSQVINIIVEDTNRKRAVEIANTTAEVFQQEISEIMNVDNVIVLYPANEIRSSDPIKPNLLLNLALACIFGLFIGCGLVLLLEYVNTSVKTEEDISELVDYPLLGCISNLDGKPQRKGRRKA